MRCPFLRDEQVKSCQASPIRKVIARSATRAETELCSTARYVTCGALLDRRETHPSPERCPFLAESLVQFCAASPMPTYVPWSDSADLRCAHDGYRFCDVYLAVAGDAGRGPSAARRQSAAPPSADVDGISMPGWLSYAPNHLWVDVGDEDVLHVGVDAFLARLAGCFERVVFLTRRGTVRPAVTLTVRGVDLTLTLPRRLQITAVNTHLRYELERLARDPYGAGWLFRGKAVLPRPQERSAVALLEGEPARDWMRAEVRRLSTLVHDRVVPGRPAEPASMADGGSSAPDVLSRLDREQIVELFAALIPPPTGGTT